MRKIKYYGLSGCAGGLAVLLLAVLACPGFSGVSAQEYPETYATEAEAKMPADLGTLAKVYVKPSVSISTVSLLNIDIAPGAEGTFANATADVKVATNSKSGFSLSINSQNTADLIATQDAANKITPIGGAIKPDAFPSNTWGYNFGTDVPDENSFYKPLSTTAAEVKNTSVSTELTTYKLTFGAKVNTKLAADSYYNSVLLSVVANPITIYNLSSLKYMQDMTPDICANTVTGTGKTLIDARDGKSYPVYKMKDGNCWMQKNLELDLGFEMTSSDTDLAPGAKITLPATTTASAVSNNNNDKDSRHVNSYWYYQWDTAVAGSGVGMTKDNQEALDSICPKGWQLPLSGSSNNTKPGNFYSLLNQYGISSSASMASSGTSGVLKFTQSGLIRPSGTDNLLGSAGGYWSRINASNDNAYDLYWNAGSGAFNPSNAMGKNLAFTVRCLARQVAR